MTEQDVIDFYKKMTVMTENQHKKTTFLGVAGKNRMYVEVIFNFVI